MLLRLLFFGLISLLLALRAQAVPTDSVRIAQLVQQGQAVESQQPEAAVRFYRQALGLAETRQYRPGYFAALRQLTFALSNLGRYAEAQTLAERGLAWARQDTSRYHLGLCHFALGITAWKQGHFPEAVRQYHRAGRYMRQLGRTYNLSVVHANLAVIYQQQQMYDRALQELHRVLRAQQLTPDITRRDLAITYFNIASTHWRQRNAAQARRYYQLTRRHLDPRKDLDVLATYYNNVGQMMLGLAETATAERRRILQDSSFYYHRQALQLSRQLGNPVDELHELNALAGIYLEQREYAQAQPLLQQALRMVRRHGNAAPERRAIYGNLVKLREGRRNYEAAFRWRNRYDAVADSLDNQETKDLLESYKLQAEQADARLKLQAKQVEINRLHDERRRQRLWLGLAVVSVVAAAGLLGLGYGYYRQRQRAHAQALLAAHRQEELRAVQAEMAGQQKERHRIAKEMHDDLGGSLTVIGLLSEVLKTRPATADVPEVHKISEVSSDVVLSMNQIIWSLNTRNDSLNGLIAYIRAYAREFLDNAGLALSTRIQEAAPDVPVRGDDRRNVFLAVKEALHNVVKHAGATRVVLRLEAEQGVLHLEVHDDGQGLQAPGRAGGSRSGLGNMAARLRDAGGSCTVEPAAAGGTVVRLAFPYAPGPAVPAAF